MTDIPHGSDRGPPAIQIFGAPSAAMLAATDADPWRIAHTVAHDPGTVVLVHPVGEPERGVMFRIVRCVRFQRGATLWIVPAA